MGVSGALQGAQEMVLRLSSHEGMAESTRKDTGVKGRRMTDELRTLIKEKYKTASRFAKKVGLSECTVSCILAGKRRFMCWHVDRFADALGVDRAKLIEMVGLECPRWDVTKQMTNREAFYRTFGFYPEKYAECPMPLKVCYHYKSNCDKCKYHNFWDQEYNPELEHDLEVINENE